MVVQYSNRKLRLVAAFVASVYILFHGRPLALHRALHSLGFYVALAVSLAVALLLVYMIHGITLWLDERYDWRERTLERSIAQFALGILLPAFTDFFLIYLYFEALDQNIIDNGFLLVDYPVILSFIILLNVYYLIHYLLLTERKEQISTDLIQKRESEVLVLKHRGIHVNVNLADVLCFYRVGKKVRFTTAQGQDYSTNFTIANLYEMYERLGFWQINRGMIINGAAVHGYEHGSRRDTLQLILKPVFHHIVATLGAAQFQVTKEYTSSFKSQYAHLNTAK